MANPNGVPLPTLRRLPTYLRILKEREAQGDLWLSSDAMAKRLGLGAIQVRKDLAAIGAIGKAKYGFPVAETSRLVTRFLGAEAYAEVFVIGAGELGAAVLADGNVGLHGFRIVAVFESDKTLVGTTVGGHKVLSLSKLGEATRRMGVKIAILAIKEAGVQAAADAIAQSGLAGIFDVTGLAVPLSDRLVVVREDFGSPLATLAGELGGKRSGSPR